MKPRAALLPILLATGAAPAQPPDPSFEISGPAFANSLPGVWQATSTNFGAPYCDSSCVGGPPTAARTGEWWCWFGGTSALEQATVSQQVALPAGQILLTFYLHAFTNRPTSTDVLTVRVDSTVVFSINNAQIASYLADYAPAQADLSAFAGGTHTITLEAVTQAGPGLTNFFVDDVSLTGGTPVVCYANCDASTAPPTLNVADFTCFLQKYAGGDPYANCDSSTAAPTLNVADFTCFLQKYAGGCP